MKLAIRGDKKRGQEINVVLTTLGGKPSNLRLKCILNDHIYFINDNNEIDVFVEGVHEQSEFKLYTLDGFLKEFPYKIGDTVRVDSHISGDLTIKRMTWSEQQATVLYGFNVPNEYEVEWVCVEDIKPINKQTTMNIAKILKDAPRGTKLYSPLYGEVILDCVDLDVMFKPIKLLTPQGECLSLTEYGRYTDNEEYVDAECILFPSKENRDWSTFKVESQFPTTTFECAEVLDVENQVREVHGYKGEQLRALRILLICRDVWWKVDNNWKPDWSEESDTWKYVITGREDNVLATEEVVIARTLAFRTKEIRDKFLETFRDLIEQCKELI